MSTKRSYSSELRENQAELTKENVLKAAKKLFSSKGFDKTTIDAIAEHANVSSPTVYSLFKSKEGVFKALMNSILFGEKYQSLVEETMAKENPVDSLKMAPKIARTIHDAEKNEIDLIRGASALSPKLKKLEHEKELQRYERQETTIKRLKKAGVLNSSVSVKQSRDILWMMTSKEVYRLLVIERGWSSDSYEEWLSEVLEKILITLQRTKNLK